MVVAPEPFGGGSNNLLPTTLAAARILINGSPVPLVYVSDKTSAALVPSGIATGGNAEVQVEYNGQLSNVLTVPVTNMMPGLYPPDSSGSGQGAITYPDGSVSSALNPASAGSVVTLWASGLGPLIPQPPDGSIIVGPALPTLQFPISVTIGGQPDIKVPHLWR